MRGQWITSRCGRTKGSSSRSCPRHLARKHSANSRSSLERVGTGQLPASRDSGRFGVYVAPFEQVVEAADAIPAIRVAFEHQAMFAVCVRAAVIFGQQVDQKLAGFTFEPYF